MKQLLQNLRDGRTEVVEVPRPEPRRGMALVRTGASLVSAGTERMLVEFAEKNLVAKAQSRPDLVRQVLDKARREGVFSTLEAAFNRLDQPMVLGYSSAGTIVEIGDDLPGFQPGDRVACAGGGYAVHAEFAVVPHNLLVKLPPEVDFESGAFTTLGAIALQGFRLAQLQLGERVAIIGLGLLGLLSVGIARAAGCEVFGVDLDERRIELARQMGAVAVARPEAETAGRAVSNGRGFDAVLICADTRADDPVILAGELARDRGTVVAVGAVGLNLPRKVYYEKELQFLVSRSYGPGRYDASYEEGGKDYPFGYVRWTEGRNMQAVVDLMAAGKLDVRPLISHRVPIEKAPMAYDLITGKTKEPFLGVLLTYPDSGTEEAGEQVVLLPGKSKALTGQPGLGILGAGNYAGAVFLPTVERAGGVHKVGVASASGLTARHAAEKFGFDYATSNEDKILTNPAVDVVAILTRHQQHARQTAQAMRAGKHVFCEKPLAISEDGLALVLDSLQVENHPLLTVGFNRRFAPLAQQLKSNLHGLNEPFLASYRVNAGYLPSNHWTQDPNQGGGRIIGEGCHFVDFLTFLAGAAPISVQAAGLPGLGRYNEDNLVMTFTFPDGSVGSVIYVANGDKSFPKERVEVFCGGSVGVLDDFRSLEWVHDGRRKVERSRLGQDKGHRWLWQAFLQAVTSDGQPPIPYDQLAGVTRATFAAVEALRTHQVVPIPGPTGVA